MAMKVDETFRKIFELPIDEYLKKRWELREKYIHILHISGDIMLEQNAINLWKAQYYQWHLEKLKSSPPKGGRKRKSHE